MTTNPERIRAWVVSADMGFGHQRAAHALAHLAEAGVLTAGSADLTDAEEIRFWRRLTWTYDFLSRSKGLPFVAGALCWALASLLRRRLARLAPGGRFTSVYGSTVRELLGARPEPPANAARVTVTFAVGGAGAQTDIGLILAQSLKPGILDGRFRLILVAGINRLVERVFVEFVTRIGLASALCDR